MAIATVNPATGETLKTYEPLTDEALEDKIARAAAAFESYRRTWLPEARDTLATKAEEAANAADRIGYPVALKVQSPDLPHKTEAGGVRLNLHDRAPS